MSRHSNTATAGLLGPVSLCAAALLLAASPLMRGGNRHVALIVLEALGLALLAAVGFRPQAASHTGGARWADSIALWLLLLSPALLAIIYLVPLPLELWAVLPGRGIYPQALRDAGVPAPAWLPLSVVPDATLTSLLAGIPLVAAFVLGRACTLPQLRRLARIVVAMAFAQVLLSLLQVGGDAQSALFFGASGRRPIGTFANSNHYANYVAMALTLYIWLAWDWLNTSPRASTSNGRQPDRAFRMAWVAGGLLLALGVLLSQSRGAVVTGLPIAAVGFGWLLISRRQGTYGTRGTAIVLVVAVLGLAAFIGLEVLLARFTASELVNSASFRALLTRSTLAGAAEFWPWGAGWGTFGVVYPRFQPPEIPGAAGHAHQDYAQMLFEGGLFAVTLMVAFLWLALLRAVQLARTLAREHHIRPETIAAALCGLGLLGFLLHSLVEFNMHIPANAILASLLAGVYLRPLADPVDP
ncbi:MAG: O-antigen ligase family protein [Telluria sp.]|nr:O-antigen ligase family protein [Telluria sp.]